MYGCANQRSVVMFAMWDEVAEYKEAKRLKKEIYFERVNKS